MRPGLALAHPLPAVTSWPGLRSALAPRLAGIGSPDHVALTFDDGPHRMSTPHFLNVLAKEQVTATFFMLGTEIRRAPALAREVAAAGHEIALHGDTHRCLIARGPAGTYADLRRGYDTVTDVVGVAPTRWRPPYGVLTAASLAAAHDLGLRPVLWTAWGRDWTAAATPDSVTAIVSQSLRGGGTVLLHDSDATAAPGCWRSTLRAVPRLLDRWRSTGWRVGPLAEHDL